MKRREFISITGGAASALAAAPVLSNFPQSSLRSPYLRKAGTDKKVIVLGMDGMDPNLLQSLIDQGKMPTFKKFIESNYYSKLRTTTPPQSPVAWASFISGTNPGGNGIYDFVHRDPAIFLPYLSTSRSYDGKSSVKLGSYSVPLEKGRVELLRHGPNLWKPLEASGIPATVFQIPSNFPIVESECHAVSGMGTPDLLGTYGTCTFIDEAATTPRRTEGVRIVPVRGENHVFKTELEGPKNSFRTDGSSAALPVTFSRDPIEETVKISIDDTDLVLKKGEWSDWIPLKFSLLPMFMSVGGMVRFFVKSVHPQLQVYISPINVDPLEPTLPISSPAGFSKEIAQAVGRYYTQGFPADTKALSNNVLSDDEYLSQAKLVLQENLKSFEFQLGRFSEGLFFFYFSNLDQNSHMLWRNMDPGHPLYDPNATPEVRGGVPYFYQRMDEVLKMTLPKVDSNTTLIILSDHGFSPFTREFNVSSWLVENGFTVLTDRGKLGKGDFYQFVDWKKSKAYALGLNGIYLNLKGRELRGSVDPAEAAKIKQEIVAKLPTAKDPAGGAQIVTEAYDTSKIYSGNFTDCAPDVVIGYAPGYRISDEAVLGKFPEEIVTPRTNKWSADHCVDPRHVPGVLLTNRPLAVDNPAIWDLAPSIISLFGVTPPKEMEGRVIV